MPKHDIHTIFRKYNMSVRKDLTNKTFGNLLVKEFSHVNNTHAMWNVICNKCKKSSIVSSSNLLSGNTKGCQYCRDKNLSVNKIKHGLCDSRLYNRWQTLKEKGVLCSEWKEFKNFHNDTSTLFEEGCSLRRVDNSKPHSKQNSFWCKPRVNHTIASEKIFLNKQKIK